MNIASQKSEGPSASNARAFLIVPGAGTETGATTMTTVHNEQTHSKQEARWKANGARHTDGDASGDTSDTNHTGFPLLSPAHLQMLREESGISDKVIAERGYRTITKKSEAKDVGFTDSQCRVPALLIPIHNVTGDIVLHQLRPDTPRNGSDGRSIKYETPLKSRMVLDIPPGTRAQLTNPDRPLFITEGPKKADCAVSHGLCCISILGVWNWRGTTEDRAKIALPDWEFIHLEGREVFIVFDSDISLKPSVYGALKRIKAFLELRKANVRVIYLDPKLDGSKVGLDDFFVTGGTIATLMAKASLTLRTPEKQPATATPDFPLTETGNAERLAYQHEHILRWCELWKKWLVYNETHWQMDVSHRARQLAKTTVRKMYAEAAATKSDDERRQKLVKYALQSESEKARRAMLELAKGEGQIPALPDQFDVDPWLLNVANGTLDLRTGTLRPHSPADYITKYIPIAYDPDATCPQWEEFLASIMAGNDEIVDFLWKATGYSLTGDVREDCLFLLYGTGANGKSTFLTVLRAILADYGKQAAFSTFLHKERQTVSNDLADLHGARLVVASETDEGKRFSLSVIKQLTGQDKVKARFLFAENFEFAPQLKLWLAANHKPVIRGTDHAIWRRIRLIPFTQKYEGASKDLAMRDKLLAELPGILAWAIRGCLAWQEETLPMPETIKVATEGYRNEMDVVGTFLGECCEVEERANVLTASLFDAYVAWCKRSGEEARTKKAFGILLQERGFEPGQGSGGIRIWKGLKLAATD